jgi:hypothetical protein
MKSKLEGELREHFDRTASRFEMDRSLPTTVMRRARRRTRRTASALVAVVVAAAVIAVVASGQASPLAGARGGTNPAPAMNLVHYVDPGGATSASESDGPALHQYVDCMREQGYALPDPTSTSDGWGILVEPGSIDRSDPAWREAAFVTCNLDKFMPRPPGGDLILGMGPDTVARFVSCMRAQGYDLPEPERSADGAYRWPLNGLGFDTSTDSWRRAAFVTCSPDAADGAMGFRART